MFGLCGFYFVLSGVILASFNYEKDNTKWENIAVCLMCLLNGWLITPILIGRILRKLYEY